MIAITVISVVIVIVGTVAATRLSSIRVRRRRKLIELFTAAISDRSVAPMPRRPRLNLTASRFRQAAGADVAVLADYRKERIRRSRDPKAATAGLPRLARHHGTEPA